MEESTSIQRVKSHNDIIILLQLPGPNSEQQRWEEEHVGAALMSFGARDSKQKAKEKNKVKDYEVIMDEEIEFVQALQMPGTISDKVLRECAYFPNSTLSYFPQNISYIKLG